MSNITEITSMDGTSELLCAVTASISLEIGCCECSNTISYSPWGGEALDDISIDSLAYDMANEADGEGWGWADGEGPLCETCAEERRVQRRSLEDSLEHIDTWRWAGTTIKVLGRCIAGEDGDAWLVLPMVTSVEREAGPEDVDPRLILQAAGVYETDDQDAALAAARPLADDVVHLYTYHEIRSRKLDALRDLAVLGGLAAVGVEDIAALTVRAGSDVAERIRAAQVEAEEAARAAEKSMDPPNVVHRFQHLLDGPLAVTGVIEVLPSGAFRGYWVGDKEREYVVHGITQAETIETLKAQGWPEDAPEEIEGMAPKEALPALSLVKALDIGGHAAHIHQTSLGLEGFFVDAQGQKVGGIGWRGDTVEDITARMLDQATDVHPIQ